MKKLVTIYKNYRKCPKTPVNHLSKKLNERDAASKIMREKQLKYPQDWQKIPMNEKLINFPKYLRNYSLYFRRNLSNKLRERVASFKTIKDSNERK